LIFVNNLDVKLSFKIARIVEVLPLYPRIKLVDAFIGLSQKEIELIVIHVNSLPQLLRDVVAESVRVRLVGLPLRYSRNIKVGSTSRSVLRLFLLRLIH